jgi:hypothetical protein
VAKAQGLHNASLSMSTEFPKEMLAERKARLEQVLADLQKERADTASHLHTELVTDEQTAENEAFCAEVRDGLENATFEDKRKYIELLDVRGKLAIENDEKVVYVRCLLGKQRVSVVLTSPSSSNHNVNDIVITARLVVRPMTP